MGNTDDVQCLMIGDDVQVCIGDSFEVIAEQSPLIGDASVSEIFEVVSIEPTPAGPEFVVEFDSDGREVWFSPTTILEAIGTASYPSAPVEPCIKVIEE